MNLPTDRIAALRIAARAHQSRGDAAGAQAAWEDLARLAPGDAEAANALGNIALRAGRTRAARDHFARAAAADPGQPALLFNLAAACRADGDDPAALGALDAALVSDPYFVQAMFQKAVVLDDLGRPREAARVYRDFLDTVPDEVEGDPRFAVPLERARAAVAADDAALAAAMDAASAPSRRIGASIAHLTGQAPLYRPEPSFLTVPELPAPPFLDRADTPWLGELEAGWEALRDEAAALIGDPARFRPYVANPPGTPLNQWQGLDHNRDWGAFFLWRHGVRDAANCARLPATAALLDRMPLLRVGGRAPNAFLSRLAPRTRIPAHNGVTNSRVTVHLPLIVPPGCGFRVGPETRQWVPGRAWVFDDTIDHEAWNDSDEPRVILIFDVWNPFLEPEECDRLGDALAAYDAHYGRGRAGQDEF
jgi:aspartyl/asparaginyl beta-hydroxylase (cupin superfamily)